LRRRQTASVLISRALQRDGTGRWLALSIGYHTFSEWRFTRTIGKCLVGVRVVGDDWAAPSFGAALGWNILRLVAWLPPLYVVGILALLISDGDECLCDRLAGTVVART
jgi:uncharacterized RDD family membrane protein YckC